MRLPQSRAELARFIDHTLLKPEATRAQIDRLCDECLEYGFFAACINPVWVEHCANRLVESRTCVVSVAAFPLGASLSEAKALEARRAAEQGAREVDMVARLGDLIAGDRQAVVDDIGAVVDAVKGVNPDALVKVILETRALTDEQIMLGCRCAAAGQADFVKTSSGFHPAGGATVEHARLLRRCADELVPAHLVAHPPPAVIVRSPPLRGEGWGEGRRLKVKAAGGIRDLPTALAMIEAGADRLGMSASVAVIEAMEG